MRAAKQGLYTIERNEPVARFVYHMRLGGDTGGVTRPGQFINLRVDGFYLRRPFSIMDWDAGGIDIIYKVVGEGTKALSMAVVGGRVDALVGLGNGFDINESCRPLLIGGGVGAPPLYALAKRFVMYNIIPAALLGFRAEEDILLADAFRELGCAVTVTLDTKGEQVTDRLDIGRSRDMYFACGPEPMLRAIHRLCPLPGRLSLETRMACGVGLCQGCACRVVPVPDTIPVPIHTPVPNPNPIQSAAFTMKRICLDGPVFRKEELPW